MRKSAIIFLSVASGLSLAAAASVPESGENFIDSLMSEMSLEEKIGQLNLPVGGDIQTGVVLGPELDKLIATGNIGGFFNVKGVDEISRLQHIAVEKGQIGRAHV